MSSTTPCESRVTDRDLISLQTSSSLIMGPGRAAGGGTGCMTAMLTLSQLFLSKCSSFPKSQLRIEATRESSSDKHKHTHRSGSGLLRGDLAWDLEDCWFKNRLRPLYVWSVDWSRERCQFTSWARHWTPTLFPNLSSSLPTLSPLNACFRPVSDM